MRTQKNVSPSYHQNAMPEVMPMTTELQRACFPRKVSQHYSDTSDDMLLEIQSIYFVLYLPLYQVPSTFLAKHKRSRRCLLITRPGNQWCI